MKYELVSFICKNHQLIVNFLISTTTVLIIQFQWLKLICKKLNLVFKSCINKNKLKLPKQCQIFKRPCPTGDITYIAYTIESKTIFYSTHDHALRSKTHAFSHTFALKNRRWKRARATAVVKASKLTTPKEKKTTPTTSTYAINATM